MSRSPKATRSAVPLLLPTWLVLGVFFLVPLLLMLGISFAQRGTYGGLKPIPDWGAYLRSGDFLANYGRSLDGVYLKIVWRSLWIAAADDGARVAVSFPMAYYLALLAPARRKGVLLALVVVPFWTSFLIRTYAWMVILRPRG